MDETCLPTEVMAYTRKRYGNSEETAVMNKVGTGVKNKERIQILEFSKLNQSWADQKSSSIHRLGE
jgi:hypothetical protein